MSRRAIVAGSAAIALFVAGIGIVIAVELGAFSSNPAPVQAAPPTTAIPGAGGLSALRNFPRGVFGGVPAAAAYLGMTQTKLRSEVAHGHTLAELARSEGKSVSRLVGVIIATEKQVLDAAVAKGTFSRAEAQLIKANLVQIVDEVVHNGVSRGLPG